MAIFKNTIPLFLLLLIILAVSTAPTVYGQDLAMNQMDTQGEKTGWWQIASDEGYILEEGSYTEGRKNGLWKGYYPDGTLKHEITFVEGVANGPARFYFENGQVWEEGIWREAFWVGDYRLYHSNGQAAYEFSYNNVGKRQGEQRYYYRDGNIMYKGKWDNGTVDGHVEVYDSTGTLQQIRNYQDGNFKTTTDLRQNMPEDSASRPDKMITPFYGTGYHTARKLNGDIYQKGYYREGVLHNGEEFIYDHNDELRQIRVYENGRIIEIKSGSELKDLRE
jgi:antitoxin component YwqK of YwqJK toxin-antitoxin module